MLFYSGNPIAGRPRSTQVIRFENPLCCWRRRKLWSSLPDRRPDIDALEFRRVYFRRISRDWLLALHRRRRCARCAVDHLGDPELDQLPHGGGELGAGKLGSAADFRSNPSSARRCWNSLKMDHVSENTLSKASCAGTYSIESRCADSGVRCHAAA